MTNISGDIEIVLDEESKEESNESFIDRKLSETQFRRMRGELLSELQEFVRLEMTKVHSRHSNDSFATVERVMRMKPCSNLLMKE